MAGTCQGWEYNYGLVQSYRCFYLDSLFWVILLKITSCERTISTTGSSIMYSMHCQFHWEFHPSVSYLFSHPILLTYTIHTIFCMPVRLYALHYHLIPQHILTFQPAPQTHHFLPYIEHCQKAILTSYMSRKFYYGIPYCRNLSGCRMSLYVVGKVLTMES